MAIEGSKRGRRSRPLAISPGDIQLALRPASTVDLSKMEIDTEGDRFSRNRIQRGKRDARWDQDTIPKGARVSIDNIDMERLKQDVEAIRSLDRPQNDDHFSRNNKINLEELDEIESKVGTLLKDIKILESEKNIKRSRHGGYTKDNKVRDRRFRKSDDAVNRALVVEKGVSLNFYRKLIFLKRSIPIFFAMMIPVVYTLVTLRVVFHAPISRIFPVFIDPFYLFIMLVSILVVTGIANAIRRYRFSKARAKPSPIWNEGAP